MQMVGHFYEAQRREQLRQQSAYTTLIYAGGGKFRYEEDVLNMAHCMEDLGDIGWVPPEGMKFPPARPNRDFSRPD